MSRVHVVAPGAIATIQDLGRPGHGPEGISASGAADPTSLRWANSLVGNPDDTPAIELALGGASFARPEPIIKMERIRLVCFRLLDIRQAWW